MTPIRRIPDGFDPCDPERVPSRVGSEVRDSRLDEIAALERRRAWMWRGAMVAAVLAVVALWVGGVL